MKKIWQFACVSFFLMPLIGIAQSSLSDQLTPEQVKQMQLQFNKAAMQQANQAAAQAPAAQPPSPQALQERLKTILQQQAQQQSQQDASTQPTTQAVATQKMEQAETSQSATPLHDQAFNNMINGLLPLSPQQIVELKRLYHASQFASATSPQTPPKPTATSQFVSLAPGATPPVIRLSAGFVSSLVFLDSTGAPWPITAYDIGDPKSFNIQWDKKSNTLMVQASTLYTYGNLAIRLEGLSTPVMLTLIPGQKAVDYRVDLRVQGNGPNAKPSLLSHGVPAGANPVLMGVLDGVAPTGAGNLRVMGGLAQAWLLAGKVYLRTRLTVLSPGWLSIMQSADGTKAYELPKAPTILVSKNGQVAQLKLEGL